MLQYGYLVPPSAMCRVYNADWALCSLSYWSCIDGLTLQMMLVTKVRHYNNKHSAKIRALRVSGTWSCVFSWIRRFEETWLRHRQEWSGPRRGNIVLELRDKGTRSTVCPKRRKHHRSPASQITRITNHQHQRSPASKITSITDHQHHGSPASEITSITNHQHHRSQASQITSIKDYQHHRSPAPQITSTASRTVERSLYFVNTCMLDFRVFCVGFVVHRVGVEQGFLQALQFPLPGTFNHCSLYPSTATVCNLAYSLQTALMV
jgi:hypothetical protein